MLKCNTGYAGIGGHGLQLNYLQGGGKSNSELKTQKSKKEVNILEEIEVKNNPLGIKAFVTNKPNFANMPKEQFDLFISSLTDYIVEYFNSEKDKDK